MNCTVSHGMKQLKKILNADIDGVNWSWHQTIMIKSIDQSISQKLWLTHEPGKYVKKTVF